MRCRSVINSVEGKAKMDQESLVAVQESAQDYFQRSQSVRRTRAQSEQTDPTAQAQTDRLAWQALVDLGWPGMLVQESAGGLELGLDGAVQILLAAGEYVAPEPLLAVAGLSALTLAGLPSASAQELLAQLAQGDAIPALAWQEVHGSLEVVPSQTKCTALAAAGYSIQGTKVFVQPTMATGWLVPALAQDGQTMLFWLPRDTKGANEQVQRLADGSFAATLELSNLVVGPEQVLGAGEPVLHALRFALALGQVLQAAEALGLGRAMLNQTSAYLRTRTQFGKPIGSFQALQHRTVDMFIHLEIAQASLQEVVQQVQANPQWPLSKVEAEASRVNARCCAAALQASRAAVQLHGAIGYTREYDLSLYYKRTLRLSASLGNVTAHQKRYAALTPVESARVVAAQWEGEFPRLADWNAMSESQFRQMVRAFLQQRYPAQLRYLSHRARWHEISAWYNTLSEQGWIAPAWPQAFGGMGLPADKMIAWIEELEQYGVARAPDQGIVMIGPLLIQHGTDVQQKHFLPRILKGEHVWCQGYSEPNAGSDLAGLRTEAVMASDASGNHFVVNGQKIWTTMAHDANHIFMLVRTEKQAKKQEGISFLLCDLKTPGITIRKIETLADEAEFCEVFFDNVRVPAENLVGELNGGWTIAKALLGFERIFLGSPKQAQYALGQLARLAQSRDLFDDPVFVQRFTSLRLDVADLSAAYTGFANIVKAGKPLPPSVSLLKIWSSETYHRIGALLVDASDEMGAVPGNQKIDGQAFNALAPLIGSTSAMIYGGTNEIQRNILARHALDLPS
jgi:3-oxochol-4-en-24-oyl-CoA dehydrogenase